jgi:EAL domain-containing protein (putative c-di-GMP-specific phosphodiesterase class I)
MQYHAERNLVKSGCSVSPACHYDTGWLDMIVKITNLDELERRYPKDIARTIDRKFVAGIRDILDDRSAVLRLGAGCIRVANMLQADMSLLRTSARVERLIRHIVVADGLLSLAAVEVTVERLDGKPRAKVMRIPASEGRMHMAHASQVLKAMLAGHLALSLQPVFNIHNKGPSLYDECLARVILPTSNCAMMPASFIPSIERAQLMNEFDRIVVSSVIDRLELDDMLVLGCNISAQSALISSQWTIIFDRLKRLPDVARRLIIEITETVPVVPSMARDFLRHLNRLGCRVAIDDFGSGYGVQNAIEIGAPDIVKLDALFLREARNGSFGIERLRGLASLARSLAGTVVIEGVEDNADLGVVGRVGCEWAQGHLHGEVEDVMLRRISPPSAG